MAKKLLTSYTFTPGAANAGTVVVPGIYTLEQFLLITNVTSGTTIYQFNVPSKGAVLTTGGGNTTLTLEFNTQSMSGADRLQVFIDDLTTGGGGAAGGLTDAELRATPVPVSLSGVATAANQATANTSLNNLDVDLGAQADAAATTDTGTFSVVSLVKRGLQNWTTLLGRVPAQGQALMAASLPVTIASNQSALPVNRSLAPALLTSYTQAGVIAINTVLATLDCSQYRSVSIQCVAMGTSGVVTPEWSNDNTNWQAATILTQAGATATTFNAAGLWVVPVQARYLRLRLSVATTAGTTTLSIHQFDDSRHDRHDGFSSHSRQPGAAGHHR
jgi:hypothetical protein